MQDLCSVQPKRDACRGKGDNHRKMFQNVNKAKDGGKKKNTLE